MPVHNYNPIYGDNNLKGKNMKKSQVVEYVVAALDNQVDKNLVAKAVDATFASITEGLLQGESLQIPGFGKFEVRERAARQGRNPATGESIEIKASKNAAFKPSSTLKAALNPDR
jgi:DNA-binding protein HU-beta